MFNKIFKVGYFKFQVALKDTSLRLKRPGHRINLGLQGVFNQKKFKNPILLLHVKLYNERNRAGQEKEHPQHPHPGEQEEKNRTRLKSVLLAAAHNGIDAPLDVGHLLQHLVDCGFVALQTHILRVL